MAIEKKVLKELQMLYIFNPPLRELISYRNILNKLKYIRKLFVVDVACGDYHSAVITNLSEVYLWGSNKNGQLGIDMENSLQS